MIGLAKSIFKGVSRKKTAVFDSFGEKDGQGVFRSSSHRNCDFRDGTLKGGVGLALYLDKNGAPVSYSMQVEPKCVYVVTINPGDGLGDEERYTFLGVDGYLYTLNPSLGTAIQVSAKLGEDVSHCVLKNEANAIQHLFSSTTGAYLTLEVAIFKQLSTQALRGGCVCGKRYFLALENGELHYCAPFNPQTENSADPNGTGVLYLPAECGAVIGLKEDGGAVYIFFERGIFRLEVSAKASDFVMKRVAYAGGALCQGSMAATGKGILFLASDGLYRVYGENTEKVCEHLHIGACDTRSLCKVGYCGELVLIEYQKKTAGGNEMVRVAIQADGRDGYFTEAFGLLCGNEYSAHDGWIYRYVEDAESTLRGSNPYFTSERLDFGTEKQKRMKKLLLKGKGRVRVGVCCDGRLREYTLELDGGAGGIRLTEKGKDFIFTLYPSIGAVVEGIEISYCTEG